MRAASLYQSTTNPQLALAICLAMSFTLLAGAFAFEYIGGLAPCTLCIWQRWPHAAVIMFAAIGLMRKDKRLFLSLAGISALTTAGIGLYHVGVEQKWWAGLAGCSGQIETGLDLSDLTDTLLAMPVIKCDEIAWQLFGLSMAGWNMVISAGIALLALLAILRKSAMVGDKHLGGE